MLTHAPLFIISAMHIGTTGKLFLKQTSFLISVFVKIFCSPKLIRRWDDINLFFAALLRPSKLLTIPLPANISSYKLVPKVCCTKKSSSLFIFSFLIDLGTCFINLLECSRGLNVFKLSSISMFALWNPEFG